MDKNQMIKGCTYLRDYSREHHKAEYGIYIGEQDFKSKGIGGEALLKKDVLIQGIYRDLLLVGQINPRDRQK